MKQMPNSAPAILILLFISFHVLMKFSSFGLCFLFSCFSQITKCNNSKNDWRWKFFDFVFRREKNLLNFAVNCYTVVITLVL